MNSLNNKALSKYCERAIANAASISAERKELLNQLVGYIENTRRDGKTPQLNFICTHNSRRSHLAQVWAFTAAYYYKVSVSTFSGGTEATAFNSSAVSAIKSAGFMVDALGSVNPKYTISINSSTHYTVWSKTFDDSFNPKENFAAVMTCSEADENCPVIPGATARISLRYEDPKQFDGTSEEQVRYEERSFQIATEMFYVFGQLAV